MSGQFACVGILHICLRGCYELWFDGIQDQRPDGRSELRVTESESQLLGHSEGDGQLPGWAAAASDGELKRCDDREDENASRQTALDIALSSDPEAALPSWAVIALADDSTPLITAASQSAVLSQADQSCWTTLEGRIPASRTTWGPVEPPVVGTHLTSAADSSVAAVAEGVCSDAFIPSSLQVFSDDASTLLAKKSMPLQDGDDKPADAPLTSAADAKCDLTDVIFEVEPSGSGNVLQPDSGRLQRQTAYQRVGEESVEIKEPRHACAVSDQHVGKETVSVDEQSYVRSIPGQSVGSETSQVDERIHLRTSSVAGATVESREMPEHAAVKVVDGQHVSAETVGENVAKPCIRMHTERHATAETEPPLSVCIIRLC